VAEKSFVIVTRPPIRPLPFATKAPIELKTKYAPFNLEPAMARTIVAVPECEDVAADNAELRLAHNSRARCVLEMDEEAVEVAAAL
jgi:hypothetical protein